MIVATQLPVNGFLGTGATFAAEVSLIVQLAMGGALIVGVILAKQKRYRAHGANQNGSVALERMDDRAHYLAFVPATSGTTQLQSS